MTSTALLSDEQRLIRDSVRAFAQQKLAPNSARWDRAGQFPRDALAEMGELGLLGMLVDAQWGGAELDHVSYVLALEEIAQADGACSTVMSVQNSVVCAPLLKYGSAAQKQRFLRPLAQGQMLGAFALTEPQAGSDASNIKTHARTTHDGYVLTGTKQFITTGANADVALVFAVTDPSAGAKGITAFIVPTDTPGYVVTRIEDKLGQRASDTAQVILEDLQLPADAVLGESGQGYKIALGNLEGGRIGIAAQSVGMARAALGAALEYADSREAFGQPIKRHQAVAFRLADMATQIEAAHHLVLHAARLRDAGQACLSEACMAKLFASEMAEAVCSAAIQVHGGYGYLKDFPVEQIYRDVRVCQIYEGTSDVQRMVISRNL